MGITNLPEIYVTIGQKNLYFVAMVSFCDVIETISWFIHFADNSTALSRDDLMYDKVIVIE